MASRKSTSSLLSIAFLHKKTFRTTIYCSRSDWTFSVVSTNTEIRQTVSLVTVTAKYISLIKGKILLHHKNSDKVAKLVVDQLTIS